eukprot:403335971
MRSYVKLSLIIKKRSFHNGMEKCYLKGLQVTIKTNNIWEQSMGEEHGSFGVKKEFVIAEEFSILFQMAKTSWDIDKHTALKSTNLSGCLSK